MDSLTGFELTAAAELAMRFIASTDRHVFLTGRAGTGKTAFLRYLIDSTSKRFVVLAPTGIAALNAKGVTLHSQFQLPFGSFIPEPRTPTTFGADSESSGHFWDRERLARTQPLTGLRREVLRDAELLIIDEVSMLRADVLDAVDFRMRGAKRRFDIAFGGAQVLLIGDLLQLPPVVKDNEWRVLSRYYSSQHFFAAHALRERADGTAAFVQIELDKVFRQQDSRFVAILNHFRDNTVTAQDVLALNRHYRPTHDTPDEGVITLVTHNNQAESINTQALAQLRGPGKTFAAKVDGEFPQSMYPVPATLDLRVGAQVMFTRNDPERTYVNGQLARVIRIHDGSIDVTTIENKTTMTIGPVSWENKRYTVNADTQELGEEVLGIFQHYPIKLAWAVTIHKAQGLTFDKAIIDVGRAFAPGQVYVALSRLRSLKGLTLRTPIDANVVRADRSVIAFNTNKTDPAQLPMLLTQYQREHLRDRLDNAFSFAQLLNSADRLQSKHAQADVSDTPARQAMLTVVQNIKSVLGAEIETSAKYRSQLQRLTKQGDIDSLLDRIGKGSEYYTQLLKPLMVGVLGQIGSSSKRKRTEGLRDDLSEFDHALASKVFDIATVAHMARCILNGVAVTQDVQTAIRLREFRQSTIAAATALPKSSAAKRPRKKDRTDNDVSDTQALTYALHKQKLSIASIAEQRGLKVTTIEKHLSDGIASGAIDIESVIPPNTLAEVAAHLRAIPDRSLTESFDHFRGAHSYGQLRMVRTWLNRQQNGEQPVERD